MKTVTTNDNAAIRAAAVQHIMALVTAIEGELDDDGATLAFVTDYLQGDTLATTAVDALRNAVDAANAANHNH